MGKIIDLTGQKFGRLTVLSFSHLDKHYSSYWLCRCDCGKEKIIGSSGMNSGGIVSCGCLQKERALIANKKHGKCHTPLYSVWRGFRDRCNNPNNPRYKDYGGRGIKYSKEWTEFLPFEEWALSHGYKKGLSLDRIDVNGNYTPSNCRWATPRTQQNNMRSNHYITFNGKTQSVSLWSDEMGFKRGVIQGRLLNGWSIEDALMTPPNRCKPIQQLKNEIIIAEYDSMRDAALEMGTIDYTKISKCCNGHTKSAHGFQWQFKK